ncbi:MAG: CsbD family protein [Nostoc sp.]
MSLQDRAKAIAKNIEGKVQETVGDLTGDRKTQAEGKEKQAESKKLLTSSSFVGMGIAIHTNN